MDHASGSAAGARPPARAETPAGAARAVDVTAFIDDRPVGRYQVRLLLACAAVLFVDGFDTQAIGYVAPELVRDWALPRGALGPVFSAGLLGLMIGALVFGPLSDRIGRKRIIVASTAAFGLGTLATAFAGDTGILIALRFLTGLGLGGAMPNAVALTSEFSPQRRRATMVMTMFCGFSVGAALGGLIAAALIPAFGWRAVFLVGGAAPLALVPLLAWRLPESVRFLAVSGRSDAQVGAILSRAFPHEPLPAGTRFAVHEPHLPGLAVAHLFGEGRARTTLLLWVVFFMSLLDLYFLSNWLPTVLSDLGASVSLAAAIGSLLQVGGVVGTVTLGRFIDRFSFRALALTYGVAAVAVAAIGAAGHAIVPAALAIFCAGFCIVGGQIASNALAAGTYPTRVRATGIGWALGIGRAGSIVGPLVGGALLAQHWTTQSLFLAAAVPALCAALAALALARRDGRGAAAPRESTRPATAP
ncbi:4-hydroxybenzoate transporter PcaK [Methylobacterium crusticola]|uniref:4-hydroxybenzoate transporter PcaK n=1 Tax=Methylobacterium crusticola TaxID=1697972 RepID=A0ABQ4R6L9_9HYPH|nr:MFS transporter [Methylobacterium crusticola]GJD52570.1 4-hydroxybenzoate transporter PcaK [Methylobacterium crusticola]